MIIWMTGQPGAGKTTIANNMLTTPRYDTFGGYHIDGDDIRKLFDNQDYSEQGRRNNVDLAQKIAQYLHNQGETVVVSLVSPYKDQRDKFKEKMGDNLIEVYVYTNEERGREKFFAPDYQPPTENFISVCTDKISVRDCVQHIFDSMK